MKSVLSICLILLVPCSTFSQSPDSTRTRTKKFSTGLLVGSNDNISKTSLYSEKQKQIIIKGNVAFTTYNLQLSPIENEIADLEALECAALLKRDTAALKTLWTRDFTLDDPLNELVNGQSTLPYYTSYSRMVEKCTVMENVVYTSGHEYVQLLKLHENLKEPVMRNYFHTWTRRTGVWKLLTKRHTQ